MLKVSFVIPSFNSAAWLPHAVKSVLDQTHKEIECVIVDDGSQDTTRYYLSYLEDLKDARIKVIRNVANLGRSVSRNIGNREATGAVICVLDADDLAYPERARLTAKAIEKGADFVHGSARVIDATGLDLGLIGTDVFNKDKAIESLTNRIVHSTVAYTKDIATLYPYPLGALSDLGLDDWAQQLAIALGGAKTAHIPHVLAAYRQLNTGITKTRDEEAVKTAKMAHLASLGVSHAV